MAALEKFSLCFGPGKSLNFVYHHTLKIIPEGGGRGQATHGNLIVTCMPGWGF